MAARVTEIFVVLQQGRLRTLYYCPDCEASNEVAPNTDFLHLACAGCNSSITAIDAKLVLLCSDPQELPPDEPC